MRCATVSFVPALFDSEANGTIFSVVSSPGNAVAFGLGSPITVKGLTNGTSYRFTVAAVNPRGRARRPHRRTRWCPTHRCGSPRRRRRVGRGATGVWLDLDRKRLRGDEPRHDRCHRCDGAVDEIRLTNHVAGVGDRWRSRLDRPAAGPSHECRHRYELLFLSHDHPCTRCERHCAGDPGAGHTATFALTGSDFLSGITAGVTGSGVTVVDVTRVDGTHVNVTLQASASVSVGARGLRLTNWDRGTSTKANAIFIT